MLKKIEFMQSFQFSFDFVIILKDFVYMPFNTILVTQVPAFMQFSFNFSFYIVMLCVVSHISDRILFPPISY